MRDDDDDDGPPPKGSSTRAALPKLKAGAAGLTASTAGESAVNGARASVPSASAFSNTKQPRGAELEKGAAACCARVTASLGRVGGGGGEGERGREELFVFFLLAPCDGSGAMDAEGARLVTTPAMECGSS